jgi:hypothetical protein
MNSLGTYPATLEVFDNLTDRVIKTLLFTLTQGFAKQLVSSAPSAYQALVDLKRHCAQTSVIERHNRGHQILFATSKLLRISSCKVNFFNQLYCSKKLTSFSSESSLISQREYKNHTKFNHLIHSIDVMNVFSIKYLCSFDSTYPLNCIQYDLIVDTSLL